MHPDAALGVLNSYQLHQHGVPGRHETRIVGHGHQRIEILQDSLLRVAERQVTQQPRRDSALVVFRVGQPLPKHVPES